MELAVLQMCQGVKNSSRLLRAQPMKNLVAALSEPYVGLIIDLEPI
jgi:hypothetical protein